MRGRAEPNLAYLPTSTVTWTFIFPLSLDVERFSVEMPLSSFLWPPIKALCWWLMVAGGMLPPLSTIVLPYSVIRVSLSLPSGDLRNVESNTCAVFNDSVDCDVICLLYALFMWLLYFVYRFSVLALWANVDDFDMPPNWDELRSLW